MDEMPNYIHGVQLYHIKPPEPSLDTLLELRPTDICQRIQGHHFFKIQLNAWSARWPTKCCDV